MIDPISIIVGALVSGLTAGAEAVVEDAVVESYRALRDRLSSRYGPDVEYGIEALEVTRAAPAQAQQLEQALRRAGADRDPELTRLAARLNQLIANPDLSAGVDPVEHLKRRSGLTAIGNLLDEHIQSVLGVRARFPIDDDNLLSTRVGRQRALPAEVRNGLSGLHTQMRRVIQQVAVTIEQSRYRELDIALESIDAGFAERKRAAALVQADKELHVSYETLRLTVEFFSELNQGVLSRIRSETSRRVESNMMFGNAIMILELTDFVIGFVSEFRLANDLDGLHAEAKKRVAEARSRQAALKQRMQRDDKVDPAVRATILEDIEDREGALLELEREWLTYVDGARGLNDLVREVRTMLPTLEVIRENAEIQILTLQLVAMLRVLTQNSDSIRGAVASLKGFRLARLSSGSVRRLLGI